MSLRGPIPKYGMSNKRRTNEDVLSKSLDELMDDDADYDVSHPAPSSGAEQDNATQDQQRPYKPVLDDPLDNLIKTDPDFPSDTYLNSLDWSGYETIAPDGATATSVCTIHKNIVLIPPHSFD